MNIKITLEEFGISGFILRDVTGIGVDGFASSTTTLSTNLRTNDIIILDGITHKRLEDEYSDYKEYNVLSDAGYNSYKLEYESNEDGWVRITHLIIPKKEWIETNKLTLTGIYYCYDSISNTYNKATINTDVVYEAIDYKQIFTDLQNENLIGVQEDMFLIGYLEKCFEDKIKDIIYNNLYKKCIDRNPNIANIYKERDILMMMYETIKFAVKSCKLYEAQRLIEQISSCSGLCNTHKYSHSSNSKCHSC